MNPSPLLQLPDDWEPTRATLHNYANAVGAIARAHAVPHPKWWHISLEVRPTGLVTDALPTPSGGSLRLRMDLLAGVVIVATSDGASRSIPMNGGLTGSEFGTALIAAVGEFGLYGDYATEKYASDESRAYDGEAAVGFLKALVSIDQNLRIHRATLNGPVGPVQVWPHGFDIAFEWFGSKVVIDSGGEAEAQLNLGFYPGGRPYFYSNPWPFDPNLLDIALPTPAAWHTEGWEGTILYYDELLGTENPAETLLEYARAVHSIAAPTLTQ